MTFSTLTLKSLLNSPELSGIPFAFNSNELAMTSHSTQHKFVCSGVVVETFEKGGAHVARVSLRPPCLELPINAHLGDIMTIDGSISISTISPAPPPADDHSSHDPHKLQGDHDQ